jgi:hypothetical protein
VNVDIPLLKQCSVAIVEDNTSIPLPAERVDVFNGTLMGLRLANGRLNNHRSLFGREELLEWSASLADLGFFALERFGRSVREKKGKDMLSYDVAISHVAIAASTVQKKAPWYHTSPSKNEAIYSP